MKNDLNYVGGIYILYCGTKVEIIDHDTENGYVNLKDQFGNTKRTLLKRVLAGKVEWHTTPESTRVYCEEYEAFNIAPRTPNNTEDVYYVYFVFHKDEIVYIGKGIGNRYKHTTSGKSHVLGLNDLYFSGEVLDVEFHLENANEDVALNVETNCIKKFKPKFNIAKNKQLGYSSRETISNS